MIGEEVEMTECDLLPKCAFFKKYVKTHVAACQGVIAEYCRGSRQSECKRKEYLLKHGAQPPENMLPGGSIIKLDAQVFTSSTGKAMEEDE
jgi:hypothetical protein